MKLLKSILGNALLTATLIIAIASTVLVAHAGRRTEPRVQAPDAATKAGEASPARTTGWMQVPRGSLLDAAL